MTTDPTLTTPPTNTWIANSTLADTYAAHSTTLRGMLRHRLVDRALTQHLPPGQQRVLDIGGGTGVQARMLAHRGHHVTIIDPDQAMLDRARTAWQNHEQDRGSIEFIVADGQQAPDLAGTDWDAVLCHGVLMYLDDPTPLLHAITQCTRPGGIVSVLAKQSTSLAMRRGLSRDWTGTLDALHTPTETNNLDTISRGMNLNTVVQILAGQGADLTCWYGVRCLTDHLGDEPPGDDFEKVLEAEWQAGRTDPYRQIARLFHLIARA